ncbi:MAG: hypothetical protein NTY03_02225 [Candidatus Bathyarchaeota archaeon]|nr:hypothetical protein [Candidatus Bathyarchaeota archaeon]
MPGKASERKWMKAPELWQWRYRDTLPGIKREDIIIQRGVVYVTAKSIKHGIRDDPLEFSTKLPYMMLVLDTWNKTSIGERVWPYSENKVWHKITKASGGTIYPHSLRFSRAKSMTIQKHSKVKNKEGEKMESKWRPVQTEVDTVS